MAIDANYNFTHKTHLSHFINHALKATDCFNLAQHFSVFQI